MQKEIFVTKNNKNHAKEMSFVAKVIRICPLIKNSCVQCQCRWWLEDKRICELYDIALAQYFQK